MAEVLDVLIIGGGPAGLTAAVYARRAGLSVILLEKEPMPGGQMALTPEIENVPGILTVDGFTLGERMTEQAKRLGADIVKDAASGLHLEPGNLRVDAGLKTYAPKALILAMGARRRRLELPGEEAFAGRGVSWCAVCDGHFFRGKPVAVIGGGNTALEDSLHMASLGCDVTLVHRRSEFRGSRILADRVARQERIKLLTPYVPVAIEGDKKVTGLRVRHAETEQTQDLTVDAVFECVGTLANTELLKGWLALDAEGRVTAGEDTETGIPGVYAVGDLRRKELYQIVTAASDGAVAAVRATRFIT